MTKKILIAIAVAAVVAGLILLVVFSPRPWQKNEASTNWSGYVAAGAKGAFSSVSAEFTVPRVHCGDLQTYSAFWVGLDGWKSDSVEQTGIEADCSGTPGYSAWYEMYPADSVTLNNTVRPGDEIFAAVGYDGGSTYTLRLADITRGWSDTETESGNYQRSSAEIITEAPSTVFGELPLTDFGTVDYSNATINGWPLLEFDRYRVTLNEGDGFKDKTSDLTGPESFWNED